ncbi:ribonuclease E/G [Anianabacter salinae]|uniref:ribonuclease E/G n=1 Tax=Anianabacter salinae TaxID=2851023 RepID=UPI00225E6778|nr:ribonuclease E/G [Anianabacter salinae]MBV0912523.1 ribonuclease E/G [Anianabacter salinae]
MKGSIVALDHWRGRPAAALIVDGIVEDLIVTPKDESVLVPGTILRGIADRPLKGLGALIVKLPGGATGYLRDAKGLAPGDAVLVQVSGYAEPGKAVPLTSKLLFKSRYAIVTPDAPGLNISRRIRDEEERLRLKDIAQDAMDGSAAGTILRSQAEGAGDDAVAGDLATMRSVAEAVLADRAGSAAELLLDGPDPHEMAWRDWGKPDLLAEARGSFADHGVLDAIDGFLAPMAPLPEGGHLYIEPTRALVAVDVNTGADTSPAGGLKANLALARELPRQLRCRGLGGQIVIDMAPAPKAQRKQIDQALTAAFRRDSVETSLVGWTTMGHIEVQRKRERCPLTEA